MPRPPCQLIVMPAMPEAVAARARQEFGAVLCGSDSNPSAGSRRNSGLMSLEEALELLETHQAPALMVSGRVKLDAAAIARLPASLALIATCSVGYDHIDMAAAHARDLIVTNTPDVLTAATADLTMMLMLCACRRAREYDAIMRAGWRRHFGLAEMLGVEMTGRSLGIVGMGRIGQAVAHRARGFQMKLLYHNRRPLPDASAAGAHYFDRLEAMLPRCDILTLHAPAAGTPLMTAERLALMPHSSILINAGRGSLVDEDALLAALHSGQLAAAGIDTFKHEPDYDLRFKDLPNVFLTPHMGSATRETRDAMGMRALDNVAALLRGATPRDVIMK